MKAVAAIIYRLHLGRTLGIAQRLVKIDDAVQGAAFADPFVERDAMPLAYRVPGARQECLISERRQSGAKQLDPAGLCPQCHLEEAGDHLFGGNLLVGLGDAVAQVVSAKHDDGMAHAGLGQHIAVEPPQSAVAAQIVQDPVAAEALVHHPQRPAILPRG